MSVVHKQLFVMAPLLRAIDDLPATVSAGGVTIECTGEISHAPIVRGFNAYRAFVRGNGIAGHIDLSSASSFRCEMSLRLTGARARTVEHLLFAIRSAIERPNPVALEQGASMDACRTA